MPAESKKLDTKYPEPFGGKSGGWVLLQLIVKNVSSDMEKLPHNQQYTSKFFAKFFHYPIRYFLNTCEQQKDNPIYHTKTFMSSTLQVKVAGVHDMGSVVYIQKSQQSEYRTARG